MRPVTPDCGQERPLAGMPEPGAHRCQGHSVGAGRGWPRVPSPTRRGHGSEAARQSLGTQDDDVDHQVGQGP
jgi:hypothetical protein